MWQLLYFCVCVSVWVTQSCPTLWTVWLVIKFNKRLWVVNLELAGVEVGWMGSVIGLNGCIPWCEGVIGYNGWFYKVGETTRPFRYDLNQIPYIYTVEVTNRFKGLDLIDRVPEELWMEVCDIVQESVIKTIPKKKKYKKAKWLSEEALQIAMKRREAKGKG